MAWAIGLCTPAIAHGALSARDNTPFAGSKLIAGAYWTSPRYGPPANQWGDILPTVWADDGAQYTMMDDGGTDVSAPGAYWKQSLARITGRPPKVHFSLIGDPHNPAPHTWGEIQQDGNLWRGPLGPYYSSGLVEANGIFFATQELDWNWGANGPFKGLNGIAYSADHGKYWHSVNKHFPAPLGNLSWVIRGRGGAYLDGYAYAIASEREFNASSLIIGRARPDVADLTDPSKWQWLSGWDATPEGPAPAFSSSLGSAIPMLSWRSHITYPQMAYNAPLNRYLLTFTYSYSNATPAIWKNGAELVILESANPWGPFQFVARESEFGPSNGYGPGIPLSWISPNGRDLWLKWAANFAGCSAHLNCSGAYGFNYRRLHLIAVGDK